MSNTRIHFIFLNVGHFLDHLFMLVFATVAALVLSREWGMRYAELIPYATPGFVAFGVCAIPAGWLADKWSREGMMIVFFLGIGVSGILTSFAQDPVQLAAGLLGIGVFAAIYHPVGLAMVVQGRAKTGIPLAVNGVFGNLGVACAALVTGFLIDFEGWRAAFMLPGAITIFIGVAYAVFVYRQREDRTDEQTTPPGSASKSNVEQPPINRSLLLRILAIILVSTAIGGGIFQSTTFALPKIFDERLDTLADSATFIGGYAFIVFTLAAFAQLAVGYLVDRYSLKVVFVFIAALQAAFFWAMQHLAGYTALVVSVCFMLAVFGQIPINDVLIGRISKSEWRSRIFALRYIVTFSVMATTVPLISWIHSAWGFDKLFLILSVAAAIIVLSVSALPGKSTVIQGPT